MKPCEFPGKDPWNEICNKLRRVRAVYKQESQSPQHEPTRKAESSTASKPTRLTRINNIVSCAASRFTSFQSHDYPPPSPRDHLSKNATYPAEAKHRKYWSLLPHQISTTEAKQCPQSHVSNTPTALNPMSASERRMLSMLESRLIQQLRCLATTPTDRYDELVLLGRNAVWMSEDDVRILQDIAALTMHLTREQKVTVLSDLHALLEPEYRYALRQVVMHGVQIVRLGLDDVHTEEAGSPMGVDHDEAELVPDAMQYEALDDLYPKPLRIRRSPPSREENPEHEVDDPEPTNSSQQSIHIHPIPRRGESQRKGSVSRARAALMDSALTSHFSHRAGDPRNAIGNHGPYPQLSLSGPSSSCAITNKPLPPLPEEEFRLSDSERWSSMSFAEQLAASVKPSPARKIAFADCTERPTSITPVLERHSRMRGGTDEGSAQTWPWYHG
ncbi:hypothetical protein BDY17DRAFT_70596 [Neohortaea acidophila]|uniref:Uncharacterized protein n=1 Tax=Neohortaea acidophila TaxID=245834 RepID=A0A6A6Q1E4_9PEZI|nr:uncharacterized protein BDY17DRAFT_70596 [Neohortaea acidophila]KAF2486075.1 hypothetical protein BDY17DRAFT_70596 [Neohortaea acidophila]